MGPMPGAKERSGWLAGPARACGPLNRRALLVPAGRASHAPGCLHRAGGAGGGGRRLLGTVAALFPPQNQSTRSQPKHQKERQVSVTGHGREKITCRRARTCPSTRPSFPARPLPSPSPAARSPGEVLELSAKRSQLLGLRALP